MYIINGMIFIRIKGGKDRKLIYLFIQEKQIMFFEILDGSGINECWGVPLSSKCVSGSCCFKNMILIDF